MARKFPSSSAILEVLRRFWRNPASVLLVLRLLEYLVSLWGRWRRHVHSKRQVLNPEDELELDLVQGCLLTAENLLNLGRVEKRTLFQVSAKKLLAKNEHLLGMLSNAAQHCHEHSHNCLVTRWLPANERYHILQASVNAVSSMFGPNYVHQNALGQSSAELFKSTWYCVTIMTPTRAENHLPSEQQVSQTSQSLETCTFTDMTRTPRPTLRIVIVHESEIRAIADGKLQPPGWGFFNSRHAERYRMLCDFSRNFQQQLIRTPAGSSSMSSRSPFTSEQTHAHKSDQERKPDGGMMKRVVSQPNLQQTSLNRPLSMDRLKGSREGTVERLKEAAAMADEKEKSHGASDENCFLRLHVPHYVGPSNLHGKSERHGNGQDHGSHGHGNIHVLRGDNGAPVSPLTPQHPWDTKKTTLAVP